jgi:hypothetical protein
MLELLASKGACAVLRGGGAGNSACLPDRQMCGAGVADVPPEAKRRRGGMVAARLPRGVTAGAAHRPGVRGHDGPHPDGPRRGHPGHLHTKANETVYVLEGDFVEDGASHGPDSFFAGQAGVPHGPHSTVGGCTVLTAFSATLDFVLVGG